MTGLLGSLLLPPRCGCGVLGNAPCTRCWESVRHQSRALDVPVLTAAWAAIPYHGAGNQLVASYKTGNRTLLRWAATVVADLVPAGVIAERPLVTWIPASRSGRRTRGRDQGRELAVGVGRLLGLAAVRTLGRVGDESQTGTGRAARLAGPTLVATRSMAGQPVLVVDDVVTTGSSMRRAAEVLHAAGAGSVWGVALAWADRRATGEYRPRHPKSGYSIA